MKKYKLSVAASIIFLICSCGNTNTPATTPGATAKETGDNIYKRTCVACHQANGEGLGGTFPPLAKSDFIVDKEKTIMQVIKGFSGELMVNGKKYNNTMPAQQLNDDEVAAVLTYINSNFGNSGGAVTAEEVKVIRTKM